MGNKSAKRTSGFLGTSALTRPLFALGAATALFGAGPAHAIDANTLPQNPNVVGGKDSFAQSGNTLNVNQSTKRTVIDWRSFDIGSKAQVNFNQPGTSAIAVNRVNSSANPTQIEGGLHANGQVWILNPNGVFFGKTAHVDAAGIVASTANIDTNAFMAGSNKLQMTGADHGAVENQGNISVGQAGLAAFVAPSVRNSGTINATVGRVALAAGTTYTLDLAGDHLVELGLGSVKAVVDNSGKIVNPGGTIALTAKAASQVVSSVVNVSGTVSASSVTNSGGTITLGGDNVTTTSTAQLSADAGTNGNGGTITSVADNQGNYAGSFSAKGGSQSGNGGKVETSGKTVVIDPKAKIVASAAHGANGQWLLDPVDLNIISGSDDGVVSGSSVTNGTIQDTLNNNTDLTLSTSQGSGGNGDISLQTAINATGTGALTLTGRHLSAANSSDVINIGGTLTLNVNAVNTLADTTGGNWINDALGMVGGVTGGTTINLGAGTYAAGTSITKNNVTIDGGNRQAKISVAAGQTGVTIDASNVTLEGLEIAGPVVGDQATITWSDNSWGVQVTHATNTNVTIDDNDIHNLRTGILIANSGNPVSGAASGSITNNVIEDTKGGILVQYRDGSTFTISGNSQGQYGNEWGIVTGLQLAKISSDPSSARQTQILNWANANNGMTVLDRQYATGNRSAVIVDATGTATAADDFGLGNGVGNERQPINNIQAGISAVVAGGTVNVNNGTYTVSSGYINVNKSLNLIGESEAGVIIDARNAATYGLRVTGPNNDVTLENFTLWGSTTGQTGKTNGLGNLGYGIKVEQTNGLLIKNVTSQGAFKSEFDLNGVLNGTLDNVTANGYSVGTTTMTGGAGIQITDSQHVTVKNSTTENNNWGGLSLQQADTYGLSETDINISGNNFTELNQIYAEDQSATLDFGTLNLTGYDYIIAAPNNPNDVYHWFQNSQQGAIDVAASVGPTTASVQGYGGSGLSGNNIFTVGTSTGGTAMSLSAATAAAANGATINVLAGDYTGGAQIRANNVTLQGVPGARILSLTNGMDGVEIFGNGDTVQNLEFAGPADQSYLTYTWGGTVTRGIFVMTGAQDFLITNNYIHGLRNDILVDGRNTGTISNNVIDNSKSGISVQYTDGTAYDKSLDSSGNPVINITDNSEGQYGNEWGVNFHLNGYWNGVAGDETHPLLNPVISHTYLASAPTAEWQQGMLDLSADNGGMSIQDQAYQSSNRTSVTVSNTGSDTNQGSPLSSLASIQAGINAVVAGGKVNVAAGTYAASGEIDVNKSLTLAGAGVGSTIINSSSSGYGMFVDADDVTLSGFTLNGPAAGTYGIKVQPNPSGYSPSDRLLDFTIENVAINGSKKTGLDLNGVTGATIDHVTVSNTTNGNGIALTDSANVTLTNDTTANNAWGGLALYQTNTVYDQQVNNIVVDGTNTFNDTIPVYAEDQSDGVGANGHPSVVGGSGLDFGTITLAGFDYVVQSPNNASDVYSWFQKTKQAAFDFATNASLSNNNVNLPTATVQGYDGSGVNGDNVFYVGTGSNSVAMSIGSAVSQATTGGTVNVGAGTYAEDVAVGAQLSFNFGGSGVTVNSLTVGSGGAGSSLSGDLTATGAIALNGATTVNGNLKAASFASNATLAMTGNLTTSGAASLGGASTVKGNIQAASFTSNGTLALTGDLTTSGAAALNGASSVTGDVTAASFTSGSTLALVGDLTATNSVTFGGATTVTGDIAAKTFTSNGTLALNGDLSASGAALFSGASSVNGNVTAGSITANNAFALNGGATASGAVALNGATTLAGNVTGGSIALGATTLGSNVTLDTSAANGAIKVASVNGSTAGGQSLAVKAGTGTVSLGNVGATTALASLTDASATTLTGATYNAGGFLFGGDVTLTAATTTLSTGGGDITFTGDIFGTADGAQSLTLNAGPGTGSPSANGNITLDNAGTSAIWLGDVTVSGNNFTADTVYVGGNYTSTLTGNQVFAADTLHTRGNVDSTVGGDASGHIDAAGDVNINAGGDVSGTIGGNNVTLTGDDVNANVTAQSNASVTGNTVEGSYAADTVGIVAHDNVDAAVNATNFQLVAAGGSVDGTWTNYTITGSGIVYLNGDPQIGVNPSQLVVEGFTLPAGTTIGANGQLILPQGVLLGLLSPGGGKPKMILVHTVQELGQLLADGYSVIVIDLSGKDKDKPIQLASN